MFKVILVDDQKLIRDGIRNLLKLSGKVKVVGECTDGSDVVEKVKQVSPDVILMDLSMPNVDGISALKQLKSAEITTPVLILTTFDEHALVLESIREGAKGFLLKDVSLETLTDAIETLAQGGTIIQPSITERLLQSVQTKPERFAPSVVPENLTDKETEILRLVASGYSNKEISSALHKSEGTIKNHMSNILSKLGVRDRTRAVLLAIEHGIL